jgi:hypothetical protein
MVVTSADAVEVEQYNSAVQPDVVTNTYGWLTAGRFREVTAAVVSFIPVLMKFLLDENSVYSVRAFHSHIARKHQAVD